MATYVLVPGGWHGGWWLEPLARRLRQLGHEAYPLTLTGVSDRRHLLAASVNLETHIQDVVSVLEAERIEGAVLVGHSYGGMVITGVADRAPGRVDALVYVDAYVPGHGDSAWGLGTDDLRRWYLEGASEGGYAIAPAALLRSSGHAAPARLAPTADPPHRFPGSVPAQGLRLPVGLARGVPVHPGLRAAAPGSRVEHACPADHARLHGRSVRRRPGDLALCWRPR